MTTKHTPAPWTLQSLPRNGRDAWVVRDVRNCALAEVGHIDAIYANEGCLQANARLIAEAPALLEALEELLSDLFVAGKTCDPPVTHQWMEKIKRARAAIARAKGGRSES